MRRVRTLLIVLAVLAVVTAGMLAIGLPRLASHRLASATGLNVTVGAAQLAWTDGGVILGDVVARDRSGDVLLEAKELFVPWAPGTEEAAMLRGRGVVVLGSAPMDVRSPRLRVRVRGDVIELDGTIIAGERVVTVEGGRFDRVAGHIDAERIRARGVPLDAEGMPVSVAATRLAVRNGSLGTMHVERLIADDVRTGAAPRRLRALVRESAGTLRLRWVNEPARLDVRARAFPLRAAVDSVLRAATASGGVVDGVVRIGRRPGTLEGCLRLGQTRLSRGGEEWLGWADLVAEIGRLDVRSRRLTDAAVDVTEPVVRVVRDGEHVWPFGGWSEWLDPSAMRRIAKAWGALAERLGGQGEPDSDDEGEASITVARGMVTFVDETMDPAARLVTRDLAGRARYVPSTLAAEARFEWKVGDRATFEVAVEGPPEPRALLAVHALPIETLAGWQTSGAGLLGIPFGRFMALAGDSVLDLRVDVPGDGREKRFGLASKAVRALIVELQDRVTMPLLAAAEERDEDDGHILTLPLVSVDADAGDPAPAGGDLVDRTAVLLAQFRELSVRLDGRAAPDEPIETGMLRARRVEAYLRTLGLGDRVEIGPPSLGTPGVVIVIRGAARSG